MTHSPPVRLLLADDHRLFRDGLAALLSVDGAYEVVGSVGDGESAVEAYERLSPDLALFDLEMPVRNGVEATRQIRENHPEARIIILTTFDGEDQIHAAISAGAKGFLLKDCERETLVKAIQDVLQGELALPVDLSSRVAVYHTADNLSAREREIVDELCAGLKNSEIAGKLGITEGTVKIHLHRIYQKLGTRNRAETIRKAGELGIVLAPGNRSRRVSGN